MEQADVKPNSSKKTYSAHVVCRGASITEKQVIFYFLVSLSQFCVVYSSQTVVEAGVTAASCYIVLCSIKGASAHNIFNQFLFEVFHTKLTV